MIAGIGVDIVEINRFERIMDRFGERMARRILTQLENNEFQKRGRNLNFIASRFAAKEAASKALGTGIAQGVSFQSIEVMNDAAGKPALILKDKALQIMQSRNINSTHLSLSDEKHYVVAMVILEQT